MPSTTESPTLSERLTDLARGELIAAGINAQPLPWYLTKPHAVTVFLVLILADALGVAAILTAWAAWAMPLGAASLSITGAWCVLMLAQIVAARPGRARRTLAALDDEDEAPLDELQTARLAFVQNVRMGSEVLFKLVAWGLVALLTCLV